MNGLALLLIASLVLQSAFHLALAANWRLNLHSSQKELDVDGNTKIYFMLSGTKNMSSMRTTSEVIRNRDYRLTFNAGSFDIENFGKINLLVIGREISFTKRQKDWNVTKVELVSAPRENPAQSYTFICNCLFSSKTPDHHIYPSKRNQSASQDRRFPIKDDERSEISDDKPTNFNRAQTQKSSFFWLVLGGCLLGSFLIAGGIVIYRFLRVYKRKKSETTLCSVCKLLVTPLGFVLFEIFQVAQCPVNFIMDPSILQSNQVHRFSKRILPRTTTMLAASRLDDGTIAVFS